jgi:hypothetical protein
MKNQFEISDGVVKIFVVRRDGYVIPVLISHEDLTRAQEFPNTWCVIVYFFTGG